MPSRPVRRSPARWLAPVALLAAVLVVGAVVSGSMDRTSSGSTAKRAGTKTTESTRTTSGPKVRVYTVKSGDVLSVIAERYNVPVARIERLNPDVDPRTLRPGIRLRLRP